MILWCFCFLFLFLLSFLLNKDRPLLDHSGHWDMAPYFMNSDLYSWLGQYDTSIHLTISDMQL